jgi:hypothetical protein
MRRAKLFPAFLSAALLGSLGASSATARSTEEAALRAINASEVADFMAADGRGLDRLWADGFVVTNPLNRFATKAEVLGMVGSGMLRFASYQRNIEYVRVYGDTGIVAGAETVVWAGRMPLAGKTSRLRFTAVWRRSTAGWREVARHANVIPER